MTDLQHRRFALWPWRRKKPVAQGVLLPPTAEALANKLGELVQFERGVDALYYFLPDDSLVQLARRLCQAHESQHVLQQGVDRELHAKEAAYESWRAVSAIWWSDTWQPEELLPTFGVRMVESLRAENELWRVVVDPRAQFFGLAATRDETYRYWMALVIGQKGQEMGEGTATEAR